MFRQSPRRNGRNKGLKIKHVLQISVLLGVSVWLLYQLHHSDDKKATININIIDKARDDSSKEIFKLGRKDLRPKMKERNETEKHKVADENDVGELVRDHVSEEHEEVGGKEHIDVGEERLEEKFDEIEKKENRDKGGEQSGVKNEKIQTGQKGEKREDGGSKNEAATKEENRSGKSDEKEKGNKATGKENKKESMRVRGNEMKNIEEGKEKKVKQMHKKDDEIKGKVKENKINEQNKVVVTKKEDKPEKEDVKKMKLNPKKAETSTLSSEEDDDDDDQSVREDVENTSREKNGEKRRKKKYLSRGKGPNHDEHNTTSSKKDIPSDENQINKKDSTKQTEKQQIDTNPDSHSVPSFEPKIANSTNPTDNEYDLEAQESNELSLSNKNENDIVADESEQTIEKDGESILEEEKDALTDLGTLPESETGGSISHDDAATE